MERYAAVTGLVVLLGVGRLGAEAPDPIPLDLHNGRLTVGGVYVNGHGPYRFLLDTGSTFNHLDPQLAESAGLPMTFRTTLQSSGGRAPMAGSEGATVRLGSASADGQVFLLGGTDALHAISADIQGVLGQVFLSRFDYQIGVRDRRLTFSPCATAAEPARTPFALARGRPVVATNLGRLVLDSGVRDLTRFHVAGVGTTVGLKTATGVTPVGMVQSSLTIADQAIWRGLAVAVPASPETDVDGLLPATLFRSIRVCNSGGYLVLN